MALESGHPIAYIARDLGVPAESLRKHVRQVEEYDGLRPALTTAAERDMIEALRKGVFELRPANEICEEPSIGGTSGSFYRGQRPYGARASG
ncbi:MAG TPA: hypothetical protein DCQ04_11505 [Actinobacteria bacterium]|nr:hypothetical protein [Actinomycetota bacterium]